MADSRALVRRAAATASPAPRRATISSAAASTRATAQRFGLGLAPDNRTALKRALGKLGEDRLVETGMLIQPEESGKDSYDRFRGRLMIPIRDPRGRVIGFGGRILGAGEPKYLNSPQTDRSSTRAARSTTSTAPAPPAAPPSG